MERKTFDLVGGAASDEGSGSFAGYASCYGVKDSQGDIVVKGAYAKTLDQFIERGFISWGHAWDNPVATIKSAREDDRGLFIEADFHSDPQSQQARIRTQERFARGKFMGLSIGYAIDPGGAEHTKDARLLKSLTLFETGLVTVPSCAPAGVTQAKTAKHGGMPVYDAEAPEGSYEDLAEDLAEAYAAQNGLDEDQVQTVATFPGHAILCVCADTGDMGMGEMTYLDVPYQMGADDDAVTFGAATPVDPTLTYVPSDDAKGLCLPLQAMRASLKAGRRHGRETRDQYAVMMTHATALVDHIGSLQAESAPKPDGKAGRQLYGEFLAWQAARLGVAI